MNASDGKIRHIVITENFGSQEVMTTVWDDDLTTAIAKLIESHR